MNRYLIEYFENPENASKFYISAIDTVVFVLAKVQAIECYDVLFPCVDDNTIEMVSDPYSTEKPIVSEKLFRNPLMFEEELSIDRS